MVPCCAEDPSPASTIRATKSRFTFGFASTPMMLTVTFCPSELALMVMGESPLLAIFRSFCPLSTEASRPVATKESFPLPWWRSVTSKPALSEAAYKALATWSKPATTELLETAWVDMPTALRKEKVAPVSIVAPSSLPVAVLRFAARAESPSSSMSSLVPSTDVDWVPASLPLLLLLPLWSPPSCLSPPFCCPCCCWFCPLSELRPASSSAMPPPSMLTPASMLHKAIATICGMHSS